MTAEIEFLGAVQGFLDEALDSVSVGIAEPEEAQNLPAIVLSLESTGRNSIGLGERSAIVTGALSCRATIDLEHPVLPDDTTVPPFDLIDDSRTRLTLPHGGLVRNDGSSGTLTAADVTVKVGDVARTVVTVAPNGDEVQVIGATGQLVFGTALGPSGLVAVSYFIGQWERRTERISGVLRVDVCAATTAAAATLGNATAAALLDGAAKAGIERLISISLQSLSSIGLKEAGTSARRRSLRFAFVFEHIVDRPDSSGGVIARIPINALVSASDLLD